MESFEYAAPHSVSEAVGLLSATAGESEVLAGGTDLLSLMKERIQTPNRLVSLKNVGDLYGIGSSEAGLRIGAMATIGELLDNPQIRAQYPSLIQAADGIGGGQMQSMGTVGGELLQASALLVFPQRLRAAGAGCRGRVAGSRRRE